jgi:hypothetical protein
LKLPEIVIDAVEPTLPALLLSPLTVEEQVLSAQPLAALATVGSSSSASIKIRPI